MKKLLLALLISASLKPADRGCTLMFVQDPQGGKPGWLVRVIDPPHSIVVPAKNHFWNQAGGLVGYEAANRACLRYWSKRKPEKPVEHPCCFCDCTVTDSHTQCYLPCRTSMQPQNPVTYPKTAKEKQECTKACPIVGFAR